MHIYIEKTDQDQIKNVVFLINFNLKVKILILIFTMFSKIKTPHSYRENT